MKKVLLLGASGSIGTQTLDILKHHQEEFSLVGFSVGENIEQALAIQKEFPVSYISVKNEKDVTTIQEADSSVHVVYGEKGIEELVKNVDYDIVVNALVGYVGFLPTLYAVERGKDIVLANKESLVVGGELIEEALKTSKSTIYPADSEHSAIAQCLYGNDEKQVNKLIITASGGAFRSKTKEELKNVTLEDALAHPNWQMGAKITVDCANMMNKGFEVIEAHYLFGIDYDRIDVLMHDESIIHSMVEYKDGSVLAQMATADMRLPLQYALLQKQHDTLVGGKALSLAEIGTLHFHPVDTERYPLLACAIECGKKKGNLPAVLNGANDVANAAFRQGKIPFLKIEEIILKAVEEAPYDAKTTVEALEAGNAWGNEFAKRMIEA